MKKRFKLFLNGLLVLIVVIIVLHITAQLLLHRGAPSGPIAVDIANRLSLDTEMSVPTWLAAFLGITAAFIALVIAAVQNGVSSKVAWYLLAGLAIFISVDEVSALHELVLQALHIKAGFGTTQSLGQNAWLFLLPVATIAAIGVLAYWYRSLPKRTYLRLLAGMAVYALGALVIEFASIQVDKGARLYTTVYVVFEEGLEFLGVWLMIRASLLHIAESEAKLNDSIKRLLGSS